METKTYNSFKKLMIPFIPCKSGFFGWHLKTHSFILISKFSFEKDNLKHYDCKVAINEDGEINICDVIYSENEIKISDMQLSKFIAKHNEFTGVQLQLF